MEDIKDQAFIENEEVSKLKTFSFECHSPTLPSLISQ